MRKQRVGLAACLLFTAASVNPVMAEELFAFADDASLAEAMSAVGDSFGYETPQLDPCRLYILHDQRGHILFDDQTLEAMASGLAVGLLGDDSADACTVESHEIAQDNIDGFLEDRKASGAVGLTLALSYYKLSESVTAFASLRDEDGNLLGSAGRVDLPVAATGSVAATDGAPAEPTSAAEESRTAAGDGATDPASQDLAEQPSEATEETRPIAENSAETEDVVRRRLASEALTRSAPERPFNLRRVREGMPPAIKTLRIVEVGGSDTPLMADLAKNFLSGLADIPSSEIETDPSEKDGSPGIEVTVSGEPVADVDAVDIRVADVGSAFDQILENRADIVVTRKPISQIDAARFSNAYGVNMRSRYAEHVVAIAAREFGLQDCGIEYTDGDILMSTEDHPKSERVYVYVNPSIAGVLRDRFLDFTLSSEGQAVVAEHAVDMRLQLSDAGYVSWRYQAAGAQEAELQDVLERFRGLIRSSQRVSSTFRFEFASADLVLDSRSEQDLENLIDLIKARDIDSRRVLLFGFADSLGATNYNLNLSRSRADAVATRLRLAGISVPPRNVYGIGEDSPVACDLRQDGERDELGAFKNRRVEVWIES